MAWLSILKWGSKLVMTGLAFKEAKDLDDSTGGHVQKNFWNVFTGAAKGGAEAIIGKDPENDTPNQAAVRALANGDKTPLTQAAQTKLSEITGLGGVDAQKPFANSAGQPADAITTPAPEREPPWYENLFGFLNDNKANTAGAIAAATAAHKTTGLFSNSFSFARIAMSCVLAVGLFLGVKGLLSNSFNDASGGDKQELALNNNNTYENQAPHLEM